MLIDPDDLHAVEPPVVIDQDPLALGQDCAVGGVPCDSEPFGDAGDSEVLNDDAFQRPPQPATRQLRTRLGRKRGVLTPHVTTLGTAVATHRDFERGRPPAQRLVRQPTDHGVPRRALAAAAATPLIRFEDCAGQHRSVGFESLSDDGKAETVESSEGGQISAGEAGRRGSVRHVEVFQMSGVGTFIFGRPRPLSGHRRAEGPGDVRYTLIWEEP